ncbi:MAG: antibiotic biosynthesis monooxygenase [Actinomycetota bacterium]|nr:antibiotic biosynthesis monooxygenase [Actinomycetota bacterium]
MIVRIFDTAINPDDVARSIELFRTQVVPVFESFPGCLGIEMLIGTQERSGDLVDVLAISRWDSPGAAEDATGTARYAQAMREVRQLFQQTPIVRHFVPAE